MSFGLTGCNTACSNRALPIATAPSVRVSDRSSSLLLVGDAGEGWGRVRPIFEAIAREVADAPERSAVIVLGDNVYPRGLPKPDAPDRREGEARLDAQVAALKATGAKAVFIPGNHDWDRDGADGWEAVKREGERVEALGAPTVSFRPTGGCPGPSAVPIGSRLVVVAIDTQWFLHPGSKPPQGSSTCEANTDSEFQERLRAVLASAGDRRVVVVAHHPLVSGGGHGGHYSWQEHLFPLRAWKGWLWVPLPVLGSIYPLSRASGAYRQDIPSAAYKKMLAVVEPVLKEHPPLLWVSGHEHGLQVLDGGGRATRLVISGGGALDHTKTPHVLSSTRFVSGEAGYARLDVRPNGSSRLAILTVGKEGHAVERYSERLD